MIKTSRSKTTTLVLGVLLTVMFAVKPAVSNAQGWSRETKADFMIVGQQMKGDNTSGLGLQMELDDTFTWGIGFGYNITDNIGINSNLLFGSIDLVAGGYGVSGKFDSGIFCWDANLEYYVLSGRFTPLATAGIGSIAFAGDINGNDFQETDFSYNVGAGLRYDISDNIFVKAIYRIIWTTMEDTDKALQLGGIAFAIGYMYP